MSCDEWRVVASGVTFFDTVIDAGGHSKVVITMKTRLLFHEIETNVCGLRLTILGGPSRGVVSNSTVRRAAKIVI
jgi:hypothetical protein